MKAEIQGVIPYFVNFTIVAVGFTVLTKKHVKKFVYQRYEHIKDAVEAAARDQAEVEERLKKVNHGLAAFNEIAEKIWSEERMLATQEAAQVAEKARLEVEQIELNARRVASTESKERQQNTRGVFIDLIAREAELKLRRNIKKDDHNNIVKAASGRIEVGV